MGQRARNEQHQLARVLRASGKTWVEIAAELRRRWPELNARAAMRIAHGWTQAQAAAQWEEEFGDPKTYKDISDYERRAGFQVLRKLACLYECAVADLVADDDDYRHLDTANASRMRVDSYAEDKDDEVKRREFLLNGAAAIAVTGLASSGSSQPQVGAADVEALNSGLQALYSLDDHSGGGVVYHLALDQLSTVKATLANTRYSDITGRRLYSVAGHIAEHAGWSAYDAGRPLVARRLYNEALYMADLAEDQRLRTLVFTSMSLNGSAREALDLSQMALRTARPFATPRLTSLLASREALAYARLAEPARCHSSLLDAERMLDEEHKEDDDDWLAFWCPAQLLSTSAAAHMHLGAHADAEAAVRTALDVAPTGYRRNEGLYLTRLSETLIPQKKFDEAASVTATVLDRMGDVSSQRVHGRITSVKQALAPYKQIPEVKELFAR